jgi:hypothetical protein
MPLHPPARNDHQIVGCGWTDQAGSRQTILNMKNEALRQAHDLLKRTKLSGDQFQKCVELVEEHAGRSKPWLALLEKAYSRLRKGDREKARAKMLIFSARNRNREAILRYLPKQVTHRTNLFELLMTWEIWLENDRMDQLEKTVPIMSKAIQTAAYSGMSAFLASAYAKYWSMKTKLMEDDEWERLKLNCLNKMKKMPGNDTK